MGDHDSKEVKRGESLLENHVFLWQRFKLTDGWEGSIKDGGLSGWISSIRYSNRGLKAREEW